LYEKDKGFPAIQCTCHHHTLTRSGSGDGSRVCCRQGSQNRVRLQYDRCGRAYGATQKNGAQLAIDEINAAAGVDGLKIVAVFDDDASVPQQGVNVFNKFINADKVAIIIGPTLSNTAQVTDRIAQQAGVPVLAISNTAKGITEIGDFIFRDSLTEAVVIPNTIRVAKDKLKIAKVAVFYGNDDAFTKGGYDAFKKALADAGIQVLNEQTFAKGDRDFSPQLTQIKGLNPDAIIVSALVEEASGIVSQARQLGIPATIPILGGNGFNSPALIKNAGEAAEGVMNGAAWNSASPLPMNQKFVQAFSAKYGTPRGPVCRAGLRRRVHRLQSHPGRRISG